MSAEAVVGFTERVAADEGLQAKVKAIRQMEEGRAERVADLAKEHGFDFTPREFVEAAAALMELNGGELDESDLEGVVGGASAAVSVGGTPQAFYSYIALSVKDIRSLP